MKDITVGFRTTAVIRDSLKEIAQKNNQTISEFVEMIMQDILSSQELIRHFDRKNSMRKKEIDIAVMRSNEIRKIQDPPVSGSISKKMAEMAAKVVSKKS